MSYMDGGLSKMIPGQTKQLGQWLLDERLLDREELERALDEQRRVGGRLGDRLVALGKLTKRDVGRCVALQHDLLWVSLAGSPPTAEALGKISADTARTLKVVPLRVLVGTMGNTLLAAAGDAPTQAAREKLQMEAGMPVEVALCDPDELHQALEWYETLALPMMRPQSDAPMPWRTTDEDVALLSTSTEIPVPDEAIRAAVDEDLRHAETPAMVPIAPPPVVTDDEEIQHAMPRPRREMRTDPDLPGVGGVAGELVRALGARVSELETRLADLEGVVAENTTLRLRVATLEARVDELLLRPVPSLAVAVPEPVSSIQPVPGATVSARVPPAMVAAVAAIPYDEPLAQAPPDDGSPFLGDEPAATASAGDDDLFDGLRTSEPIPAPAPLRTVPPPLPVLRSRTPALTPAVEILPEREVSLVTGDDLASASAELPLASNPDTPRPRPFALLLAEASQDD